MVDAAQMAAGLRNFMPAPDQANSPQAIVGALQGQPQPTQINFIGKGANLHPIDQGNMLTAKHMGSQRQGARGCQERENSN